MKRFVFIAALFCLWVSLLSGCGASLGLEAEAVSRVKVSSLPESSSLARDYTSPEKTAAIVDYLNSLSLQRHFPEDPDEYCGQTYVITLFYEDGHTLTVCHFGNRFLRKDGEDWLRMRYKEAAALDGLLRKFPGDDAPEETAPPQDT